jgi:hypothetical protein
VADQTSKNWRRAVALKKVEEVVKQLEAEGASFKVSYRSKDSELKAIIQIEKAVEVIEYLMAKRAVPGKPSSGKSDEKIVVKTQKEAVTKKEKE